MFFVLFVCQSQNTFSTLLSGSRNGTNLTPPSSGFWFHMSEFAAPMHVFSHIVGLGSSFMAIGTSLDERNLTSCIVSLMTKERNDSCCFMKLVTEQYNDSSLFRLSFRAVVIPEMLYACEEKNKIDKRVARFVIPFCVTLNADGSALYITSAAIFIAQFTGADIGASDIVVIGCGRFLLLLLLLLSP